ncbi:hypothetical protein BD410DRAFT_732786, partial [Rickenella mellea]
LVYDLTEVEIIMEVMEGAPTHWMTILTTQSYDTLEQFQKAIRYHEDILMALDPRKPREDKDRDSGSPSKKKPFFRNKKRSAATARLVGWSPASSKPPFPKDDSVVSKGKTPEQANARPCRHCGSGKHWDNDCKYHRKDVKKARTNNVTVETEDVEAQEEYDELYYSLATSDEEDVQDEEEETEETESSEQSDF